VSDEADELVWQGRFIEARRRGRWEYAARARDITAAVIVAVDDAGRLVLIDQPRVPIGRRCLELPAGLVGDEAAGEAAEASAARELEEETGFRADCVEALGEFYASPGMTSERFTIVRATGLTRVGEGGGVDGEDIVVHLVPLAEVAGFVAAKRAAGFAIDAKLLVALGAGMLAGAVT
jgi:ADP-ribose pyrophosphatase